MGIVFWGGSLISLGPMRPDCTDAVLELLRARPGEWMTSTEVWNALDRRWPDNVVWTALYGLVHTGEIERTFERRGRGRLQNLFRIRQGDALTPPDARV